MTPFPSERESPMMLVRPFPSLLALSLAAIGVACSAPPDDVGQSTEDLSAPTCHPSFANDAVPAAHRAMLDTIAFTEGTAGSCGQDGYSTGFAYNCFTSCDDHPYVVWNSGGFRSSAAGRYQFLDFVWKEFRYPSFSPRYQDIAAVRLIQEKRQVYLPSDRALTATEFSNAMSKLSWEWASLPPFRYAGQGRHSTAEVRAKYCSFAGCDGQRGTSGGGDPGGNDLGDAGASGPGDGGCAARGDGRIYCENKPNAPIYSTPGFTRIVDRLKTTTSWFDCWSSGALHGGGNRTWYHTQGDNYGNWGWVPAVEMKTTGEFDADPTSRGLPKCR